MNALQAPLRRAFMRVEALFNRAFGDRLNPLYHLGATSFFLFWIVGATGLVLYAFFDTSVSGAYRSVQAITHGAFGVGGVVRSVHRYASDAMVLTMLLHLLRHYAFDRLRGFRWFSWVTGVALLWLVYVAGANGYMLPWDRLAQFVTQSSFEWLDALPGIGGRLSRNFLVPEAVNDRLFSLLVFVHIGVPLATLLLIWVHVQRVPKATTVPTHRIAVALVASMLVLAVVLPVASQGGPADLASVPGELRLDGFLLALFPLFDAWPGGAVWALVGGGTLLLAALPWLLPRRGDAPHQLTLHPGGLRVTARPGETLLEAGLRGGLTLPYDCRGGGCGACACTVLAGRVDHGAAQQAALTPAMRAHGRALMCCAVALEDVEVEVEGVASLDAAAAVRRWQGRVERMTPLAGDVMQLTVALANDERIEFRAGQYLNVVLDDGARRAFSFANAPHDNARIELHVRLIPGGRFTTHVFAGMREGDAITLEGPLGRFALSASERPALLVAGATGFAPIKSIVEDALHRGVRRPMRFYWGVRHAADFYLLDVVERWQREHAGFVFVPVVSDDAGNVAWRGRRGLVHEALLHDHPSLAGVEVYACGSLGMVRSAVPDFVAHGLAEQHCYSDAFVPGATAA